MKWYTLIFLLYIGKNTFVSGGFSGGGTQVFTDPKQLNGKRWQDSFLISRMTFRLVKKSWTPKGIKTDEVLEEYTGTVDEAFNAMWHEKYPYIEHKLDQSEKLFTMTNERGEVEYDPELDSIIIIHPVNFDADVPFVKATFTAMRLRNLHKKYNFFAVDMSGLNRNMEISVYRILFGKPTRYEPMAEALSLILLKGIEGGHWTANQIHLIGYSYSSNLVGYMGRYIQLVHGQKIGSILGVDPYAAQYNQNLIQLSFNDAKVVHVYHFCSYMSGTRERIATADFVFNDGFIQPECRGNPFKRSIFNQFACSHDRAANRLWYIILFPSMFKARKCETFQRLMACYCEDHEAANLSYPIESNPAKGTYYMKTDGKKPYGLGEKGSHCPPENKQRLEEIKDHLIKRANARLNP